MRDSRECWTCQFYNSDKSECRRHPPALIRYTERTSCATIVHEAGWPKVKPDDSCGDWTRNNA